MNIKFTLFLVFIVFVGASCGLPSNKQQSTGPGLKQLCFGERCFEIEVAETQEERFKGLQNRQFMSADHGMLFVFPESKKHRFWMKDTYISLDMIWMDGNKKVVTIIPNVLPCKTEQCPVYTPDHDASYVLELNAGTTIEIGLKVGDQATF